MPRGRAKHLPETIELPRVLLEARRRRHRWHRPAAVAVNFIIHRRVFSASCSRGQMQRETRADSEWIHLGGTAGCSFLGGVLLVTFPRGHGGGKTGRQGNMWPPE